MSGVIDRRDRWVAALFLASGAALLVFILAGISLRLTFLGLGLAAAVVLWLALRRVAPQRRRKLLRRMAVGAAAGLAATLVYDVSRLAMVEIFDLHLRPFEAWRLFGLALAGDQSTTMIMVAGVAFHLCNGVAFGTAYTVAFGRSGIVAGVIWALILETFMVSVYPGWLGLKALEEFLSVSITAHVFYGIVLGGLARYLLTRSRWREDDLTPTAGARESVGSDH